MKVGSANEREEVDAALRCRSISDEDADRECACLGNSSLIGDVIEGCLPRYSSAHVLCTLPKTV